MVCLLSILFIVQSLIFAQDDVTELMRLTTNSKSGLEYFLQDCEQILKIPSGSQSDYRPDTLGFSLKLSNDNKFFTLVDQILPKDRRGDDRGFTHGYLLKMDKDIDGRLNISIVLSNDLFTQEINGEAYKKGEGIWVVPQHFSEERKIVLSLNNNKQDHVIFWNISTGPHHIVHQQNPGNPLSTSNQQEAVHDALSKTPLKFQERIPVWDGRPDQFGALLEADLGFQKSILHVADGLIQLTLYAKTGLKLSTLKDANSYDTSIGGNFVMKVPDVPILGQTQIKTKTDITTQFHQTGIVTKPSLDVTIGNNYVRAGFDWTSYIGKLQNHVDYNLPSLNQEKVGNDDIVNLYLEFSLDVPKK